MFEIYDGRLSFYQWDSGEKIRLTETPTGDCQVHFQNTSSDVCLTVAPKEVSGELLADVPNILLQSPETITVWCYVSDGDEKHTIRREDFEVTPRQKPSDYVYSETEVLSFDSKLNKNFGTENAGKALIVGEDGNVICGTASGGSNVPITYIKSLDRTNPNELCKLDAGIYILYGYFTPYAGSGRSITYDNRLAICDVNTKDGTHYFQIFSPYKNTVMYLVVTDSTYERTDTELSGIVTKIDTTLSNSSTYPLQNKAITEALNKLEARIVTLESGKST